ARVGPQAHEGLQKRRSIKRHEPLLDETVANLLIELQSTDMLSRHCVLKRQKWIVLGNSTPIFTDGRGEPGDRPHHGIAVGKGFEAYSVWMHPAQPLGCLPGAHCLHE